MGVNSDFLAPCGLYCGVCGIYYATRDDNRKFRERLLPVYKGRMPGSEDLKDEDIRCEGCLSERPFLYCRDCDIKKCATGKGIEGCHQCREFPCSLIEEFPIQVGKTVILRAVPARRRLGTERWIQEEEARYVCPQCGHKLFRGARRCNQCKTPVSLDG